MILFKNDWDKYPYAIPDYDTSNQSFLRLSGLLKHMGVENNTFLLSLHDVNLVGVNPHDENLTDDLKRRVAYECNVNPWYFFREVVRIPPPSGVDPLMYKANRSNISATWLFLNHITIMMIQPRQTFKSGTVGSIFVWLLFIKTINNMIGILTKNDDLRVDAIKKMKGIINLLPSYLDLRTKQDSDNYENISVKALGNKLVTMVPQASKVAASNIGRGMTLTSLNIDEFPFINNISTTLAALMPTITAARDVAKSIDAPYGTIITTTPGYLSSESGRFAYSFYNGCFRWSELLFDEENRDTLIENIKLNSPSKKVNVLLEYNHRQLGYTDEWLKQKIDETMLDPQSVEAEFLNIWGAGTETSPLSKDTLNTLKNNIVYDYGTTISEYGYITRWYISEEELHKVMMDRYMVIGLDTSDAIGNDEIGLVIRDSLDASVIAVGNYNETNLITFSEWLCQLLLEFKNSVIIIERKSSGVAIIDNLILLLLANNEDPFKRIFNWVVNDYNVNSRYREILDTPHYHRDKNVYDTYRSKFGFSTTGSGRQGRDKIYGKTFTLSTKYTANAVKDKQLTNQLLALEVRNGRIDHKVGNHDDLVFAWLLAFWLLSHSDNKKYYGIEDTLSLVDTRTNDIDYDKMAKYNTMKTLLEEYRVTINDAKKYILWNKIKKLYEEVTDISINPNTLNIDKLLEEISVITQVGVI